MSKILDNLNEQQLQAVTYFKGAMLVIAGAGSGKTRALTHRIAYLIEEKGVSPWNILAVTFTNKAANEMKKRITRLLGEGNNAPASPSLPTIGTFHSVCIRILRKHIHLLGYENVFVVYDDADQQILIKRIIEEMGLDIKKVTPKAVLNHISNAKNQLIGPGEYMQFANDYFSEKVAQIYPRYQKNLQKNSAVDFDDIIMKTVELFQQFPDILDHYQEKFKFISVDEYQDTNKAQYVLIKLLAQKYQNICVIGDADQSIYSWRGATIQNILDFEKDYPETKVVVLEQNYRSTQIILDASNTVIQKNLKRKDKKLWTERAGGQKIRHWLADNERHEAEMIANEIENLSIGSESPCYNDFVALYRTNAQSRVLEEVLLKHGIPYRIVGGIRFYQRKEIKDILAYLRVVQNPNDSVSLLRIINVPARKIGAKTLECLQEFAYKHNLSLFNAMMLAADSQRHGGRLPQSTSRLGETLASAADSQRHGALASANDVPELSGSKSEEFNKFVKIIKELQKLNTEFQASGMIKLVLERSGYKKFIDDGSVEAEARLENIAELVSVAAKYDKLEPMISLSIFLEEVSLIADVDSIKEEDNAVTLMTVHSAKGLEFPYVFIAGLEEGIFPHNRSLLDRQELEEERRLMYVAMTRAMDGLYLLHARERTLYGESRVNAPSQFLEDISVELVEANFGGHGSRHHLAIEDIVGKPIPVELDMAAHSALASEFGIGDKVGHNVFGNGIVINITGGVATIAFEDPKIGIKKLALSVAPLRKV